MGPGSRDDGRVGGGDGPGVGSVGEPSALYALYRAERGPLTWFLRSQGVAEHEAEDAVQAAFVRLLQSRLPIREPRAWLRTVALNEHRRSSPAVGGSRTAAVVVPVPPADLPGRRDPTDLGERAAQADWALRAISGLPERQRQVMARHYDGQPIRQIGADLGLTEAAVRQNLHRARRALAQAIGTESTLEDQR